MGQEKERIEVDKLKFWELEESSIAKTRGGEGERKPLDAINGNPMESAKDHSQPKIEYRVSREKRSLSAAKSIETGGIPSHRQEGLSSLPSLQSS